MQQSWPSSPPGVPSSARRAFAAGAANDRRPSASTTDLNLTHFDQPLENPIMHSKNPFALLAAAATLSLSAVAWAETPADAAAGMMKEMAEGVSEAADAVQGMSDAAMGREAEKKAEAEAAAEAGAADAAAESDAAEAAAEVAEERAEEAAVLKEAEAVTEEAAKEMATDAMLEDQKDMIDGD
jgi:hypothetical protein